MKMHAEYLTNVAKNCYKDKWISEDFTNMPQIELCKEEEKKKVLGKLDHHIDETRYQGKRKYVTP
jgi:hypothetical protein